MGLPAQSGLVHGSSMVKLEVILSSDSEEARGARFVLVTEPIMICHGPGWPHKLEAAHSGS